MKFVLIALIGLSHQIIELPLKKKELKNPLLPECLAKQPVDKENHIYMIEPC